jgi:hypothetical protein
MTSAVLPTANETGVPLIVTADAPAMMVCPLTTTAEFVIDKMLDEVVGVEKREGPRRVGGDKLRPLPVVGVISFVAALPPCGGDVPSIKPLPCRVITTVM